MNNLQELFPTFDKELLTKIEANAEIKEVKSGDVLMRKGQYIKHTILVLKGTIKIYRNDEEGGEFFYVSFKPGPGLCNIHGVCCTARSKSDISHCC